MPRGGRAPCYIGGMRHAHHAFLVAHAALLCLLACAGGVPTVPGGAGGGSSSSSKASGSGGEGGAGGAASSSAAASSATGSSCLRCATVLTAPNLAGVPLLCPDSAARWKALTDCACDTEPTPPPGLGICAGPCTAAPTKAGSWCGALYQEPSCLACLSSSPNGCGPALAACEADK